MISIALKFIPDQDSAPRVVASGEGYIGDLIQKIAKTNSVPLYSEPVLAKELSKIPVGDEIPTELYRAVALIFSYINEIENKISNKSII